jgi:SAM-dependent methyltransferase
LSPPSAVEAWGRALEEWALPEEILARVPESPWAYPIDLFRIRTKEAMAGPPSPSAQRALEALPERGSVLDVGSGAGAASLGLLPRAGRIVAVDPSEDMLEAFAEFAAEAEVDGDPVLGAWPDVASEVEAADVVVCHHVLYNVADLKPFIHALDEHALNRVVIEIPAEHPRAWMNDLWKRFHDLDRPDRPTADDAEAALIELDIAVKRKDWLAPPGRGTSRQEAVALARSRLALSPGRDEEVAEALGDRLFERDGEWFAGPPDLPLVTLWWDSG